MKPIENSRIAGITAIGRTPGNTVGGGKTGSGKQASPASVAEAGMVQRSGATRAGSAAPINTDRVNQIREAIREGRYPLVPAQVADAMIAAGMFLSESTATPQSEAVSAPKD